MWVDFLYTVIDSLPFTSGLMVVSKKGIALSSLLFSTVNLMARSTLNVLKEVLFIFFPLDNPSVIHIPEPYFGVGGWQYLAYHFFLKVLHVEVSNYRSYFRPHSCTFYMFIKLTLERKVENYVFDW